MPDTPKMPHIKFNKDWTVPPWVIGDSICALWQKYRPMDRHNQSLSCAAERDANKNLGGMNY